MPVPACKISSNNYLSSSMWKQYSNQFVFLWPDGFHELPSSPPWQIQHIALPTFIPTPCDTILRKPKAKARFLYGSASKKDGAFTKQRIDPFCLSVICLKTLNFLSSAPAGRQMGKCLQSTSPSWSLGPRPLQVGLLVGGLWAANQLQIPIEYVGFGRGHFAWCILLQFL